VRGVAIVATGTWVHRGHEHEGAGILDGILGTRDGDLTVFERLTEHFEGRLVELWQLIQMEMLVPLCIGV